MLADLHPAPEYTYAADHREAHNRDQLRIPSDYAGIWKRAVENLANELCITPMEAHYLLIKSEGWVTKGIMWEWWT